MAETRRPPPLTPPHKGEGDPMRRLRECHPCPQTRRNSPLVGRATRAKPERGGGREALAPASSLRGAQRRGNPCPPVREPGHGLLRFARNDEPGPSTPI